MYTHPCSMRPTCVAQLALLFSLLLTEGFRVKPRGRHSRHDAPRVQNSSVAETGAGATMTGDGIVSVDELADESSSKDVGDAGTSVLDRTGDQWKIPQQETGFDYEGPYDEITRCRQELAASFPTSLWRSDTTPGFQVEAVLDIPADLVWDGVTNNCSKPHKVNVYYPVGASGPIPLVSYAHGFTNGAHKVDQVNRVRLFQPLAEEGFFVIAYQHGGTSQYCSEHFNQLGAIEWLKTSSYASMVDFSKVGVIGHSMGGKATWRSTRAAGADIKVAVSTNAHCVFDCPAPAVPTLMIAGNGDRTALPSQQKRMFDRMTVPGMFARIEMGHGFNDEFTNLALQPLIFSVLSCYLRDDQEACSAITQRSALEDTCFGTTEWTN